jgi:SAM-dependent methyltransferase
MEPTSMRWRCTVVFLVVFALCETAVAGTGSRWGRPQRTQVAKARVRSVELHPKDGVLVGRIEVTRGAARPIGIFVTGRGVEELRNDGPPGWFDVTALRGKRVLDVGTGDGQLVVELRRAGVDAFGIDLVRAPAIPAGAPWFAQADAADPGAMKRLGRGGRRFDVALSSYAVFLYEGAETQAVALRGMRDLVVRGGLVRLVGVRDLGETERVARSLGGLDVVSRDHATRSLELRRR